MGTTCTALTWVSSHGDTVSSSSISTSQTWKLRHKEVKSLRQSHSRYPCWGLNSCRTTVGWPSTTTPFLPEVADHGAPCQFCPQTQIFQAYNHHKGIGSMPWVVWGTGSAVAKRQSLWSSRTSQWMPCPWTFAPWIRKTLTDKYPASFWNSCHCFTLDKAAHDPWSPCPARCGSGDGWVHPSLPDHLCLTACFKWLDTEQLACSYLLWGSRFQNMQSASTFRN